MRTNPSHFVGGQSQPRHHQQPFSLLAPQCMQCLLFAGVFFSAFFSSWRALSQAISALVHLFLTGIANPGCWSTFIVLVAQHCVEGLVSAMRTGLGSCGWNVKHGWEKSRRSLNPDSNWSRIYKVLILTTSCKWLCQRHLVLDCSIILTSWSAHMAAKNGSRLLVGIQDTRHIRSFHNAEAAMHPWQRSHAHHSLIPDEVIQSSPQHSYTSPQNSQHTPCSLLDVPHGDILMFNDPFFNNDPPARSESPLQANPVVKTALIYLWTHHHLHGTLIFNLMTGHHTGTKSNLRLHSLYIVKPKCRCQISINCFIFGHWNFWNITNHLPLQITWTYTIQLTRHH